MTGECIVMYQAHRNFKTKIRVSLKLAIFSIWLLVFIRLGVLILICPMKRVVIRVM